MTMGQSSTTSKGRPLPKWQQLLRHRLVIPAAIVALLGPVLLVAGTGNNQGNMTPASIVLVVLLVVLAVIMIGNIALRLAGFDGDVPAIAGHLATDPDQRRLLSRWLERARWARFIGGLAGCVAWILGTNANGDLLLLGTGGIAIGAMLAELHHVRRPHGPRTARLDVRTVRFYAMARDTHRMIAVGIAAVALCVVGVVAPRQHTAPWFGLAALIALGTARAAQQRVAGRPRPAVPEKLMRADDLARELAIGRGLARPGTYFAVALVAHGARTIGPNSLKLFGIGQFVGTVAWLYAVVLWWSNRRLGLDFLLTEDSEPVLA